MMRRQIPILVCIFAFTFILHWYAGTFHSEFGRYQDEGMHYVTGLLIHDFIASGHWSHPMAFAKDYYAHFPKVGLGNWPPGFPLIQSAWTFLFGVSRNSVLLLMMFLLSWIAFTVYRVARGYVGMLYAMFAALLMIVIPLSQAQASMVMAEIPLALFSLLAVLAYIRFLEMDRTRDAVWFAFWTFCAVMTKGNAWVIMILVPALAVTARRISVVRSPRFWLALGLIAIACGPYTLLTMRIVRNGWNTQSFPGFDYILLSLWLHTRMSIQAFGIPVSLFAFVGVVDRVLLSPWRRKQDLFWPGMAVYGICIIVFHGLVPTSIEPRKIYQIVPVMALLVVAGMDAIARRINLRTGSVRPVRYGIAGLTAVLVIATNFYFLKPFRPGFAAAVEALQARDDTRGAALLISSNPLLSDAEAAIIAQWASRERNAGTYLIRATKLISRPAGAPNEQPDYELIYKTPDELQAALDAVPVSYVILHTTPASRSYRHHALLQSLLSLDPQYWQRIYSTRTVLEQPHTIDIYHRRKDLRGVPVRFSVDLSDKIGESIKTK